MNLRFSNVDGLCSSVRMEDERPVIDLSEVTFFNPFALVYLGMFLRYFNSQGKNFSIALPQNVAARKYLAQQKFWQRFNFNPVTIEREKLSVFTNTTSLNDIVDVERRPYIAEEIADQVMRVLKYNNVKINIKIVSELVCELVDNFARHSESTLAAVAMQYYPNLHRIQFAIGDCGIGIRSSLASNPKYAHLLNGTHPDAALMAFEPLVSCKSQGGTGLSEVREGILNMNGRLELSTGDGYVIIGEGKTMYGPMAYNLTGVQIGLSFPEEE